jgi:uncharacterized membrane protein YphA (DoxX/SURF4 family)
MEPLPVIEISGTLTSFPHKTNQLCMKKTAILYWVFTILISGLMLFSTFPHIIVDEQAVQFMSGYLGYPKYIIPFLGVAKLLGVIVILVPGLARVKEWAYAGLAFDLVGAMYSIASVPAPAGVTPGQQAFGYVFIGGMLLLLVLSYIYYHKLRNLKLSVAR